MKLLITLCFLTTLRCSFSMEIFGHRGSSALAPENTLKAIEMTCGCSVRGVEFDLKLTQDKQVIIAHDSTLERVAANTFGLADDEYQRVITTPIENLDYAEILSVDVGAWKGDEFKGAKVPTLQLALQKVPKGKVAMLDFKADSEILTYVDEILKEADCEVIAVSFRLKMIKEIKARFPAIPCYYIRLYKQVAETSFDELLQAAANLDGFSLEASPAITEELVRTIHERGQKVMTWVDIHPAPLDTEETLAEYKRIGVDYFITNQPEKLGGII